MRRRPAVGRRRDAGRAAARPAGEAAAAAAELPARRAARSFRDYRVVAYYGAPQDAELGALGHRQARAARSRGWSGRRSPTRAGGRPVLPALELIAVVAAADPGDGGRYNLRQPDAVIRRYLRAARKAKALLVLDIQPGRSDFFTEATRLRKWLREPDVGLALDPEWRMAPGAGARPGDRPRRRARGQRDDGLAVAARRARPAAAEALDRPPVHRRHGRRDAAQGRAGAGDRAQRRRLRHAGAQDRQVQRFPARRRVPAGLQALLQGGHEDDEPPRQVLRLQPPPDVVVYE